MIASHYPIDTFWFDIVLYLLIGVLAPLVLLLCCWGIGALLRKRKAGLRLGVAVGAVAMLAAPYGFTYGISQVKVRHVTLAFDDLPEAFDGYRILHIGDLHVGTYQGWRAPILKTVVDSAMAQQVDMIAFTGDLQNKTPDEIKPHLKQLQRLKAKDGICSVMGNHDYPLYVDDDDLHKAYNLAQTMNTEEDMGWSLLNNTWRRIRRGEERIYIAGMENDGEGRFPQLGNITSALTELSRKDFVVMLEHDPTSWRRKILTHSHCQLTLSGHTHGGQFSLFGWSPAALSFREHSGMYYAGDRAINVTSGLGGVVPFRFGTPPEIVVITLKKK